MRTPFPVPCNRRGRLQCQGMILFVLTWEAWTMSVDSATQDPHKGGRKTPGTLGVGLVASFLYPVLYYYLVHLLRIEDPRRDTF